MRSKRRSVALRKELSELGVDAGAATIGYHWGPPARARPSEDLAVAALAELRYPPAAHKGQRSSQIRFQAHLHECWRSDVTH